MAEIILATQTTPGNPSAGNVGLYFDSADGLLKSINSAGVVTTYATGSAGAMAQIFDSTLAVAAASFDITGIPATYNHLYLVGSGSFSDAAGYEDAQCKINNDGGANYDVIRNTGESGATVGTASYGSTTLFLATWSGTTSTDPLGSFQHTFFNYAKTTLQKSTSGVGGGKKGEAAGDNIRVDSIAGFWRNTAAINRLTIISGGAGNFIAGSRVTLYGLT